MVSLCWGKEHLAEGPGWRQTALLEGWRTSPPQGVAGLPGELEVGTEKGGRLCHLLAWWLQVGSSPSLSPVVFLPRMEDNDSILTPELSHASTGELDAVVTIVPDGHRGSGSSRDVLRESAGAEDTELLFFLTPSLPTGGRNGQCAQEKAPFRMRSWLAGTMVPGREKDRLAELLSEEAPGWVC